MTKKRMRIGILFNFRKGWMGGIIYIINLVNALNFLDEDDKPEIIVFYNDDLEEFLKDFNYPHLTMVKWKFPGFLKGYLTSWLTGKNMFVNQMVAQHELQGVYPLNDWPVSGDYMLRKGTRVVAWIPDLQHKFYPHFFTRLRVRMREIRIKILLHNTRDLAVSSHDVGNHFRKFYKLRSRLNIHVLRFVSIIRDFDFISLETLQKKYGFQAPYFIVSNQFTNHKNHMVILRALDRIRKSGHRVHIVFTGKMEFKGNEAYIQSIRAFIQENKLESYVSLLGIIPRHDQLSLMKHAAAIVQPSLFEGWSTVIEDAKSLQVPVIASDLAVNIEQLGDTGVFFSPHDDERLSQILIAHRRTEAVQLYADYHDRVKSFAKEFISIFRS